MPSKSGPKKPGCLKIWAAGGVGARAKAVYLQVLSTTVTSCQSCRIVGATTAHPHTHFWLNCLPDTQNATIWKIFIVLFFFLHLLLVIFLIFYHYLYFNFLSFMSYWYTNFFSLKMSHGCNWYIECAVSWSLTSPFRHYRDKFVKQYNWFSSYRVKSVQWVYE